MVFLIIEIQIAVRRLIRASRIALATITLSRDRMTPLLWERTKR